MATYGCPYGGCTSPGLARRLQAIASLRYQGGAWQEKLLAELSRLHLLLEAWQRRDSLPAEVQADVLAHIGFNQPKEDILTLDSTADHWQVVGQRQEDDGQMRTQRTWLYGMNSQRFALLLDFAVQQQPMTLRPPVGQAMSGDMVFYPSATPLRALLKDEAVQQAGDTVLAPLFTPLHQCFSRYAEALIANPWLGYFPFAIARVIPVQHDKQWLLVDVAQHCIPLDISDEQAWVLLGESGGQPLNVFGEWDGYALRICGTFPATEVA